MFKYDAILELKEQEPYFLEDTYNKTTRRMDYICPACGNGSGESGTGLVKYKEKYHCFVCNKNMDIFDLAQEANGLDSFAEAALWLFDYYGIKDYEEEDDENWKKIRKKQEKKKKELSLEEEAYYAEFIRKTQQAPDYSYLLSRGISVETQQRFGIGYDSNVISPKKLFLRQDVSNITPTKRCIIPTSEYTAIARDIRPDYEIPEKQKNFKNLKIGPVHFFNFDSLKKKPQYTFVVEGEIDALSLIECGFQAVALGSVSNMDAFVEALLENDIYLSHIFVLGDDDEAGQEMGKKLVSRLNREYLCTFAHNVEWPRGVKCKDANDFLRMDKKRFVKWANQVLKDAALLKEIHIKYDTADKLADLVDYLDTNLSDFLEKLIDEQYEMHKNEEFFWQDMFR